MATKIWKGGAAATAQVDTMTVAGTWATSDTLTTTLTAEDSTTTQSVVTVASGGSPSVTDVRDQHLADLQVSSQTMFTKLSWSSNSTDKIDATATIPGVPFYISTAETAATGTYTRASATASTGPHDWNTVANWQPSGVPVDDDEVKVTSGAISITYGLDQSAVNLQSFRVSKRFTGNIGDPNSRYYLTIDVDNSSTSTPFTNIATGGRYVLIQGAMSAVYITRSSRVLNSIRIGGDSEIDQLYIMGPNVVGGVIVGSGMALDNLFIMGAQGAMVDIESGITGLDQLIINRGGQITARSVVGSGGEIDMNGGRLIIEANFPAANSDTLKIRGGEVIFRGNKLSADNILGTLTIFGGTMDLREIETASMTIGDTVIYDGLLTDRGGLANITYTNDIIQHGGQVESDSGSTVSVSF